MGVSSSKIEDEKALQLCRERKHLVKQAIDGRCSLAAAHVSYIQSLKNTGTAFRKFVEPEVPTESSLYTSTSATPKPLALTDKSIFQFSNSSPSPSQHVDVGESFSPVPSPRSSGRFHVNHMKAGRSFSTTVEEKLPIPVIATLQSSTTPKHLTSQSDENSLLESPSPPPGTPPWDYFGLFHPIDNQFSFQDGRGLNFGLDNGDDIRRLREEEGIPELEEEGEKASTNGRDDFVDSEDDFDQQSSEPLVRMFRNRNVIQDHHLTNDSPAILSVERVASETEKQNGEKNLLTNGKHETDETPELTPSKMASSAVALHINGKVKEPGPEIKFGSKDLLSCMKELEDLFFKAFDSGTEVPRMLEANEVNFRPLFPEEIAHRSKASIFLTACFACCKEEVPRSQVSSSNEIKYLTWHKSVSSLSSSSRNPLGATSKEDIEDLSSNLFSSRYMNSGSHASTLDRLYAWERKLYDEIKASSIIRREYDMKCRLLRHQESRAEKPDSIDKTRAAVKDLHSRIRVGIQRIDSISKRIQELRDKELQPQLEELIGGLTQMWVMMLDCHKNQYSIISGSCNNGSTKVSTRSESHRQATMLLERELSSLCSNFTKWISAQKSYIEAINGWIHKCVFPRKQKYSKRKPIEFDPKRDIAPPIFVTCQNWLALLNELPMEEVANSLKDLVTVTTRFLPRQEKGHENSKLSLTFSRKTGQSVGLEGDIDRNESPVDWSLNYDSLLSGLAGFLNRLKTFAESSVQEYENLQKFISAAHLRYENSGLRM
ncbi:protein ROLLING AND ERECT LEAF 2-like [Phoenix dactylifera]|uniref:Protein ROLLING AND ERECT LEAF 2-like n=1 Tax=Phoenix dactylifera TaxID=42345 RepID=A0A8B9AJ48_PHODC|nr:protein ROLLING AND ERECT LEAF 2-like [Phoenix dactylifera]XP_008811002.1 protein ROLLING AND ERECT LEAF 2-like [Phoenix dactylifera]XP_008811003.1 protein ROLLING AND ERECT LEAF 2-like [Phoenix dactylifera]XP_008811005.1 protein ROLLING AND ERECT LEAF 2-like [Phoenix dactylifera]XP_038986741.1 protein ROLLING AND ERECT LEAF 2-like [Phoenix dactylifera]XP_038986749.1 protein ROLLING AND ERECT LEAF 2-like [Phoenix dactylifera]XP_038986766.1 protein ROLLING AND ERECT LEAF 2-like [Phoenix dac